MTDLEKYRLEIEEITDEMLSLFEKRLDVSKKVAAYKKAHDMPIFQPEREKMLIAKLCHGRLYEKECEVFLQALMDLSKQVQKEEIEQ